MSGAEVTVNYYMPPMPRMPPMNYTVAAAPDGAAYRAVMELIMSGPWNIIVRANPGGKSVRVSLPHRRQVTGSSRTLPRRARDLQGPSHELKPSRCHPGTSSPKYIVDPIPLEFTFKL